MLEVMALHLKDLLSKYCKMVLMGHIMSVLIQVLLVLIMHIGYMI